MKNPGLHVVILAGGSGTRFWPLSREQMPKQLLRILGDQSMLAMTLQRALALVPEERVWAVTTRNQSEVVRRDLTVAGASRVRLLEEPAGRNTAAAIGLAALAILEEDPGGMMAVFPADHYIREEQTFVELLSWARTVAEEGWLVTLGIKPTRPETGYGYILKGEPLTQLRRGGDDRRAFKVRRFVEKPNRESAERYVQSGEFLWNSGVFVWPSKLYVEEMGTYLPGHLKGLRQFMALCADPGRAEEAPGVYESMEAISVDYGVLEHSDRVAVIPAQVGWSDVGSWASLMEIMPKDREGNVLWGDVLAVETRDSMVRSEGRLVATLGVRDLVVVETEDAILVSHMDRSQEVRKIAEGLRAQGREEAIVHREVRTSWGKYKVVESGDGYKVKRLEILPGKSLSLQSHRQKAQHWIVAQGKALVTSEGQTREVQWGGHVCVPSGSAHRVENHGPGRLLVVEVQTGDHLGEDDAIRLEDD